MSKTILFPVGGLVLVKRKKVEEPQLVVESDPLAATVGDDRV